MGKKKPPELPPFVKGWWEYSACEPDTYYMPISVKCRKHRLKVDPLKNWKWAKIQDSPSPFKPGPVMLQNLSTSKNTCGYLTRLKDASWKLLRFLTGETLLHIPQREVSQWCAYKIWGGVKLPSKENGGRFMAMCNRDYWKCNDKEHQKDSVSTREDSEQECRVLVFPKEG